MNSQGIKTELIKKGRTIGCNGCGYSYNYTLTITCKNEKVSDINIKKHLYLQPLFQFLKAENKLNGKENSLWILFVWTAGTKEYESDPEKPKIKSESSIKSCYEDGLVILVKGEKKKIKFTKIKTNPYQAVAVILLRVFFGSGSVKNFV